MKVDIACCCCVDPPEPTTEASLEATKLDCRDGLFKAAGRILAVGETSCFSSTLDAETAVEIAVEGAGAAVAIEDVNAVLVVVVVVWLGTGPFKLFRMLLLLLLLEGILLVLFIEPGLLKLGEITTLTRF